MEFPMTIKTWKKNVFEICSPRQSKMLSSQWPSKLWNKLEMCQTQYDTDAPTRGHPYPHVGILQKMKLKKGHNSHNNWQFYPKSKLTYILWLYTCV